MPRSLRLQSQLQSRSKQRCLVQWPSQDRSREPVHLALPTTHFPPAVRPNVHLRAQVAPHARGRAHHDQARVARVQVAHLVQAADVQARVDLAQAADSNVVTRVHRVATKSVKVADVVHHQQ